MRVLIYGSCVSRDTFEFLPDSYSLLSYVARQSAISAGAPAVDVLGRIKRLPSDFQQRMVRGDVKGDLHQVVRRLAPQTDLVLVDLVDERGGVLSIGGGYVTKLAEFWAAGGKDVAARAPHVPFGSAEHFELWSKGIDRLVHVLREEGLLERTLVLRTPWARLDPDGDPIPVPGWMMDPDRANDLYRRYFNHVSAAGLSTVSLPDELARSPLDHRWGPSPFHYSEAAYRFLASRIEGFVADREVLTQG